MRTARTVCAGEGCRARLGAPRDTSWLSSAEAAPSPDDLPFSNTNNWARLLRRILEVDPLLCPRCGVEMKIVSVITEPNLVDTILRSLARGACRDPFAERAPPTLAPGGAAEIDPAGPEGVPCNSSTA